MAEQEISQIEGKKISQLTEKTTLVGDDIVPILDSEDANSATKNKKTTFKSVATYIRKAKTVYVDAVNGDDTNTGTSSSPYKTLKTAINSGASLVLVVPNTPETAFGTTVISNKKYPITVRLASMDEYSGATREDQKIYITSTVSPYDALRFVNCTEVHLYDIYAKNMNRNGFRIDNCGFVEFTRCIASDNDTNPFMGFSILNSNVRFYDCVAYNIDTDGFNFHGYGNSEMINCIAHDCGDDGASHHEGCTGVVIGGEFYNCGKGGVSSPTYGASVDIIDVYSHDNDQYGIYADGGASATYAQARCNIYNCYLENNTTADIYAKNCKLNLIETFYKTKSFVNDNLTVTEKNSKQVVNNTATSPLTIEKNTCYKLGTISELTISNRITSVEETEIQFTADTDFAFTSTAWEDYWIGGEPTFEDGETYVIAIKNGYAVCGKVGA